ncbi:MAG: iron-sulfur cluster repair di-iron protein [Flavobacteriaceae bacterium]
MTISKDNTVASVVTKNIKTAHIFKKHGIDFCCGGGISLEKACDKNNVNMDTLIEELTAIDKITDQNLDFDNWELDVLIDHIVNTHHSYVSESVQILSQYANKVAKVHGHHYDFLIEVNTLFHDVANELVSHMQKEEQILFPYIKKIVNAKRHQEANTPPPFGTVSNPITMMEHEHESAGEVLRKIATLTDNYTTPPGACNTFKALYSKLEEFEQDLHQHIHLENNILHPKAISLEKSLQN